MVSKAIETCVVEGEKYALIGLNVKMEGEFERCHPAPALWAFVDTAFTLPTHWREWLGKIRSEEMERCNLFLLSKSPSMRTEALDAENDELWRSVGDFYTGLVVASPFAPAHKPVHLTGSRRQSEIEVRQQQDLETPIPLLARAYPPVRLEDLDRAAVIAESLEFLRSTYQAGSTWQIFQTLRVYLEARTRLDILDRIHQYCRCIDGLILPDPGKTTRQFKNKTKLFIGDQHHSLMGEIYNIRSAVEHLHVDRYLQPFDRNVRLELIKREAIVEHIARTSLIKILSGRDLLSHFTSSNALAAFWNKPFVELRRIWGEPIDPYTALADFEPKYITDGVLGRV